MINEQPQQNAGNGNPNMDDSPQDDMDYEDYQDDTGEPDYWYCFSCEYSCAQRPAWGGQCPRCTAIMEPEYW